LMFTDADMKTIKVTKYIKEFLPYEAKIVT
jgi:hypothetical protein